MSKRIFARAVAVVVVILAGLGNTGLAHAAICRVTATGSSGNDGSDWTLAMDLPTALADPVACTEIWVAGGVYVPGTARSDTFGIKPGVAVYGGFAGSEDSRDDRDAGTNATVLSGDIDNDDANVDGNRIDETPDDIVGDNSLHVVTIDGTTGTPVVSDTVLDGFVITGGKADGSVYPDEYGGGLYCNGQGSGNECSPTLSNLVFIGNSATSGGAQYNNGVAGKSSPVMSHVVFSSNEATGNGGALYNAGEFGGASSPSLTDVTFTGNRAGYLGGAVLNNGNQGVSSPTLENVTFHDNYSASLGGAMYSGTSNGVSNPSLTNVTFGNNHAAGRGGAMYNAAFGSGDCSPVLVNVTFSGNVAYEGGAMWNHADDDGSSNPSLSNVILWADSATASGQEILNDTANAVPSIEHSIVQGGCPDGSSCTMLVGGDPLLGPLQDNGGTTWTMLPAIGSSALDTGTCATATDQRGVSRPQGAGCDIGAVESASLLCYVDAAAVGGDDGTTWANAYVDLQSALSDAVCAEIWVAAGIYRPGPETADTFSINRELALYGGFAGGESSRGERDPAANRSILSGDVDADDADDDGNGIAEFASDIVGGNSYHVVTIDGTGDSRITSNTVIDGFTITGGDATGADPLDKGGGLFCDGEQAGGECSPTLHNVVFAGNRAVLGGAMYNNGRFGGASDPTLGNVTFSGNEAGIGGAMYNYGYAGSSSPTLGNATFSGNVATNIGGAMYNHGYNGASSPVLQNVTFSGNHADHWGGAMTNDGRNAGSSNPVLSNVILWGNTAGDEAAQIKNLADTAADAAAPVIDHSIVQGSGGSGTGWDSSLGSDGGGNLDANPFLGPLALHGGSTATILLGFGSPAMDTGNAATCSDPATVNGLDQRGVVRPQGPECDIGAVEMPLVTDRIFADGFESSVP